MSSPFACKECKRQFVALCRNGDACPWRKQGRCLFRHEDSMAGATSDGDNTRCLRCLCLIVFTPIECDTSAATSREEVPGRGAQCGQRAPKWQCAAWKVRSHLSKDTCWGCNKQKDEAHDEYIHEWAQTAALATAGQPCEQDQRGSLASARQQLTLAKASAMPKDCVRTLESKVWQEETACDEAGSTLGKEDGHTPQKALETLKQAQQEVVQDQMDLDKLMQEAPLPVLPVPQVNVSL